MLPRADNLAFKATWSSRIYSAHSCKTRAPTRLRKQSQAGFCVDARSMARSFYIPTHSGE
jgi:hypothetical protein